MLCTSFKGFSDLCTASYKAPHVPSPNACFTYLYKELFKNALLVNEALINGHSL